MARQVCQEPGKVGREALRLVSIAVAWGVTIAALTSCTPHPPGGAAPSAPDRVLDEQRIAASHQANLWLFLRDNVPQFTFVVDGSGRATSIRSQRGRSSIVLAGSDAAMVIVDGARLISLDVLQQMPLDGVVRIEILSGSTGTALQGTNAGAGVIYIHTRYAPSAPDPNSDPDTNSAGLHSQSGAIGKTMRPQQPKLARPW